MDELKFAIQDETLLGTRIKVIGVVLYSFQRGEGPLRTPGMGIRFDHIRPEDQNVIKEYIKREITKGITMSHIGDTVF